jgi:spectinomycin phosphotransferase
MRYPPQLPEGALCAALETDFGLAVAALDFLPVGMDSWAYRLEDAVGGCWFARLSQSSPELSLTLIHHLVNTAGLAWIPGPRVSRQGYYAVPLGDFFLSVQPFVAGVTLLDQPLSASQATTLGQMLASLHRAVTNLPPVLRARLPVESYDRHQALAQRVLATAQAGAPRDSIQAELNVFIAQRRALIEALLHRGQALGRRIRRRSPALVLAHADIHGGNLLLDPAGELWMIDWDGAMLAPGERDLMFWCNEAAWPAIASSYGLLEPLDVELVHYYRLEWVAQEIADYGENVYFLDFSAEQRADSLAKFKALFDPGDVVEAALKAG